MLRGDDHDFDNTFFVVPPRKQEVKLLYAGSDAADDHAGAAVLPASWRPAGDPLRQVEVQPLEADDASQLSG